MSVFPLIKRFQDIIKTNSVMMLKEEAIIHDRCFRSGTVFSVIGWREIKDRVYLVLSKGSWEGLVDYEEIHDQLEKIDKIR